MVSINKHQSETITMLRGLLIFLVVYVHIGTDVSNMPISKNAVYWLNITRDLLTLSAVPLYFSISGFLLFINKPGYFSNLKKKFKRIFIPYFLWNSMNILFNFLCQKISIVAPFFLKEDNIITHWGVTEWVDAYLTVFDRKYPFLYTTWYLRDLMVLNVCYFLFKYLIEKKPKFFFIVFAIFFVTTIDMVLITKNSIVFFLIGAIAGQYWEKIQKNLKYFKFALIMAPISIIICRFSITANVGVLLYDLSAGIIYIMIVSSIRNEHVKKVLKILGKYSFWIFLFHEPIVTIIRKIIFKCFNLNTYGYIAMFILLPIAVILLCLLVAIILNKKAPKIYKILTGSI